MEAYPIGDQTSNTIAEELVRNFISQFGIPLEIHTDQGRSFYCKLIQDMCKLLYIKKIRSTSYHPQSKSMIERFNQTLAQMIRTHALETRTGMKTLIS